MQIKVNKNQQFPFARLVLRQGETAQIQRASMVYHTEGITLKTALNGNKHKGGLLGKAMSNIGRAMTTGESALITQVTANQDGVIALSSKMPGQIAELTLDPHQYYLNDGVFLAMSQDADLEIKHQSLVKGMLSQTGGMLIMHTTGDGQMLINAFGSIQKINLDNDAITIDNQHVLAWEDTLDYDLHFESGLIQSICTSEGLVNTFKGTGSVYLQTLNLETFADTLNKYIISKSGD